MTSFARGPGEKSDNFPLEICYSTKMYLGGTEHPYCILKDTFDKV